MSFYKTSALFFIPLFYILMLSCNNEEKEKKYIESLSPVTSVKLVGDSILIVDEVLEIVVTHSGLSGCASFSRYETDSSKVDTLTFLFYQREAEAVLCTQQSVDIFSSAFISFQDTGTKTLLFNGTTSQIIQKLQVKI